MNVEFNKLDEELVDNPFASDRPGYMFWSDVHCLAAERLGFALSSATPLVLFTAASGSGKSEVVSAVVEELSATFLLGYIENEESFDGDATRAILKSFGAELENEDESSLTKLLEDSLAASRVTHGVPTLIVENASSMERANLQKLFDASGLAGPPESTLFKLVLVGDDEIRRRLSDEFGFASVPTIQLDNMSDDESKDYIRHRLAIAQYRSLIFTEEALNDIVKYAGGNARQINAICTASLDRFRNSGEQYVEPALVRRSIGVAMDRVKQDR